MQINSLLVFCCLVLGSVGLTVLLCWTGWWSFVAVFRPDSGSRTSSQCGMTTAPTAQPSTSTLTHCPSSALTNTPRQWLRSSEGKYTPATTTNPVLRRSETTPTYVCSYTPQLAKRRSNSMPVESSPGISPCGMRPPSLGSLTWSDAHPCNLSHVSSDDDTDAELSTEDDECWEEMEF